MTEQKYYETTGTLYAVPTLTGEMGLIALDYSDYEGLLALGIMDEEIDLTIRKGVYGSEYRQHVPEFRTRASLYAVKMDSSIPKPQIELSFTALRESYDRGFRDSDKVDVKVTQLPYRIEKKAPESELKLDLGEMGQMVQI